MHNHWFTLNNYWQAIAPKITGARITQAFTYEKNECSFILLKDREQIRIDYSGRSELPYMVLKDGLNIPRRKVLLFDSLYDTAITEISMIPGDRILRWRLEDDTTLYFEFFGGSPNIFQADASGNILSSFKDMGRDHVPDFRDFSGYSYPLPEDLESTFPDALNEFSEKSIKNVLTQLLPHWTGALARETVHRAGIDLDMQTKDVPEQLREGLASAAKRMIDEIEEDNAFISRLPHPEFSLLELHHKSDVIWDLEMDIEEAYGKYIGVYYRGRKFRNLHSNLKKLLGNKIERLQRRMEKQQDDLNNWESAETYRRYGDLLMANLHDLEQGAQEAEVEDIIGDGGQITIPLKPDLSIVDNAQAFYEKAKKTTRGRKALQKQIAQTEDELTELKEYYSQLDSLTSLDGLHELESSLEDHGISTKSQRSTETTERLPYTEYVSPDGWRVLVGRTARDNDELTFHTAHKEDFWFHAENVPGSHVIAVSDNKRVEQPPKATIEYAAGLAAGHSQAQHSNLVPVVYTKRKYVTKPRDAGPGLVRHEFSETVIVEPRKK